MGIQQFFQQSGCKVLAMARLTECEYSIMLYLMNCAISGLDELITTEAELSVLTGHGEEQTRKALANLVTRDIVKIIYGDLTQRPKMQSICIGVQFDMHKWQLDFEKDVTHQDAIVFPFRRQGITNFQVVDGQRHDRDTKNLNTKSPDAATWERIVDSFARGRELSTDELQKAENSAKTLVDTHPVDQVILLVRHFGMKIPTLSLLASNWQHYLELYENEHQKVDMIDARQKYQELDQKVRDAATTLLEQRQELGYGEEEITVLSILSEHRHPRRQLFWAYQLRSRYPKLSKFFEEMAPMMLPVTSTGSKVKRTLSD